MRSSELPLSPDSSSSIMAGYPLDTLKTRLQTGQSKGIGEALRSVFLGQEGPVRGFVSLYRGMASPVAGYVFMSGLSFGGFGASLREALLAPPLLSSPLLLSSPTPCHSTSSLILPQVKKALPHLDHEQQSIIAGFFSGAAYSLASTPVDRVKIQMQSGQGS